MTSAASKPARKERKRKSVIPPSCRLKTFLRTLFIPLVASAKSHEYRSQCRRAVREFSVALGRPATIADLCPDGFSTFKAALPNQCPSSAVQTDLRRRLIAIWNTAAQFGAAAKPPRIRTRKPKRLKSKLTHAPQPLPPAPGSLREFFETAYRPHRLLGGSKCYVSDIRKTLRWLEDFSGRTVRPEELSDEVAANFIQWLIDKKSSRTSVNGMRGQLLAVWRYANELGRCQTLPRIKKLKVKLDEPDAWTEEQLGAVISATETLRGYTYKDINAADYYRAILLFAWWTGLRLGSIFGMKVADVDLSTGWVVAGCETAKNGRGKQFRIGTDAIGALKAIIRPDCEFVFSYREMNRLYKDFDSLLRVAGIPPSRRRSMSKFHKIRRTSATAIAVRKGVAAASAHLGHSSEQVTRRYIDPSKLPGNDATAVLPNLSY